MPKRKVQMERDDITIEVMESSVPRYEENGWTVVDDGDSEEADASQPKGANADPNKDEE
jgi:hypothetical protein